MDFKFNLNLGEENSQSKSKALDESRVYDVFIIGGGPSGMTAAVYTMRKGMDTAIVTEKFGGQVAETIGIENYLGFKYVEGQQLVDKFTDQVKQFEIAIGDGKKVISIDVDEDIKKIQLDDKRTYQAKTIIIASGCRWRHLGVPGEDKFLGKGVAFCSTCDGPLYAGKNVVVVGGGNSGIESALDLVAIASKVTIVEFADKLKADEILLKKLKEYNNVDILLSHQVVEIQGDEKVRSLLLKDRVNNSEKKLQADGIFVEIGLEPNSQFAKDKLTLNKLNEIIIDCSCNSSVKGVFAAGDVTSVKYNQIIIAAGEGAKAALSAYEYIIKNF